MFQTLSDSVAGGPRDLIRDFLTGTDTMDLTAIDADAGLADDQAFAFIGAASSREPPASCRRRRSAPTRWCQATWTATARNLQILLSGTVALQATDFLL